jgi:PEGA domain
MESRSRWPTPHRAALALSLAAGAALSAPAAAQQPPPPPPADAAAPARPLAESLTGMARAEYEGGRILYADKDFGNAIVKFEKAHELARDPRLLWNIAVCEKNLRRYSRMLRTIRRYQSEAARLLSPDERTQAAEIIKTVETFVSALKLTSSEAGAEVYVDDEKLGVTPLVEPVMVDVGKRRIRVVKAGFREVVLTPEVVGGGELVLDVPLEKDVHRGRLQVFAGAEDIISVDGHAVGRERWEGSVPSGGHSLKVSAPGMAPYQSEVVIADEKLRRVDVTLSPAARTDTTRTVLWVAGGVVLAAGAAVGGYFLFKPQSVSPVNGSLQPGSTQLSFGSGGISFGRGHR